VFIIVSLFCIMFVYLCKFPIKFIYFIFNPLRATSKPQSNTIVGTLAVDWASCYIWYSEEGRGRAAAPPSPLLTEM